jgi:hypothetical protein
MGCGTNSVPASDSTQGVSDFVFAGDGDFSSFPCVISPNTPAGSYWVEFILLDAELKKIPAAAAPVVSAGFHLEVVGPPEPVVPSWSVTGLGDLPGSGSPDDPFVFQAPKDPNDWVEMAMTGVLVDPDGVAVHHSAIPLITNTTLGKPALDWMGCGTNSVPASDSTQGVSDFVFAGDGDFSSFPCVISPNTPAGIYSVEFILLDAELKKIPAAAAPVVSAGFHLEVVGPPPTTTEPPPRTTEPPPRTTEPPPRGRD